MKAVVFAASSLLGIAAASSLYAGPKGFQDHDVLDVRGEIDATCACPTHTVTVYEEASSVPGVTETASVVPFTTFTTSRATVASSSPASIKTLSSPASSYVPETTVITESSSATPSSPASSSSEDSSPIAASSTAASSTAAPASRTSSSSTDTNHRINGHQWAITYTPYDSSGNCKSASAVSHDIATIAAKGFTTVRLYAPDCSGLQTVGAACAVSGLNLIAGIYIDANGVAGARPQIQELVSWSQDNGGRGWQGVEMVVVGNEAVFQGFCSAAELADFMGEVRRALTASESGYRGPITTTETLETLVANKDVLCPVADVVAANIHPFFNSDCTAAGAGDFVASSLRQLSTVCPGGKEYYNLETGWPSRGSGSNGAAVPGDSEQKTAVESISEKAGGRSCMFSFENDSWKEPGDFGVEQYWGCASWF